MPLLRNPSEFGFPLRAKGQLPPKSARFGSAGRDPSAAALPLPLPQHFLCVRQQHTRTSSLGYVEQRCACCRCAADVRRLSRRADCSSSQRRSPKQQPRPAATAPIRCSLPLRSLPLPHTASCIPPRPPTASACPTRPLRRRSSRSRRRPPRAPVPSAPSRRSSRSRSSSNSRSRPTRRRPSCSPRQMEMRAAACTRGMTCWHCRP